MATRHRSVDVAPTRIRHRKSVDQLTPAQLRELRKAIAGMAKFKPSDERSFSYLASLHGGPPRAYCKHGALDSWNRYRGAPLFLPWHRAYLYFFELEMQDRAPEATLAWWDWTSPQSHATGIPKAYSNRKAGTTANPLNAQPIAPGFKRPSGMPANSWRDPDLPERLPTPQQLEAIIALEAFEDFSTQLEQKLHNMVHGWVGGSMGDVPIAAYDPVFYAHHTMIDRIWRLWQLRHGRSGPPPSAMASVLEPFNVTVGEIVDVTQLGYEYAGATARVPGSR